MSLLTLLLATGVLAAPAPVSPKPAKKARPSAAAIEEGERRMARGAAGVRTAASPAELKEAAAEFEAAAAAVPTLADAHYNAGVTYAKAGEHAAAVRNLKRYIELAPKALDLKAAKAKLAEEEFLLEKEQKAQTKLAGTWGYVFDGAVSYSFGKLTRELQGEALGGGRYKLRLVGLGGTAAKSEESFEFTLDGDKLTGTFRWDGVSPATGGRLCDAVSSPLSGELKNGDTLEFRYQSRMFETGCGTTTPTHSYKKVP